MTNSTISVRVDDELLEHVDQLAEQHNTTRSEVARHLLDNGARAQKYYSEFELNL